MHPAAFVRAAGPNPDEWLRRLRLVISGHRRIREAFEAALSGCPLSGEDAADRADRPGLGGVLCVGLFFAKAHPDVLRRALHVLWAPENTYHQLTAATDAAGGITRDLLRRAAYRVPTGALPSGGFTVWRYGRGTPEAAMSLEGSWSTYRLSVLVEGLREARRHKVPVFVGRRTVDHLAADTILAYWPAWDSENPWGADEIRFDAAPAGTCVIEDSADHVDLAAEWLAMAADPRMRERVMGCYNGGYRGGPDLPAWGDPSWRDDAATRMAWARANPGLLLPKTRRDLTGLFELAIADRLVELQ